jgi:O-antigen chain-terminating methyltransferase
VTQRFYREFEDKYRGSREDIKGKLKTYLDFVLPVAQLSTDSTAVDLGCGRGEWLELLREHDITAVGVDQNKEMLEACFEIGLNVIQGDALAYLRGLSDSSVLVVSGFHIAEHLPFDVLQELYAQAHRVLVPLGLLILETPNPENLVVGASSFYMDPTHERPIPPQLLTFLAQHTGFERVMHLRLQDNLAHCSSHGLGLFDVLAHSSQDQAVVAQKKYVESLELDKAFVASRAASMRDLAIRYDQTNLQRFNELTAQVVELNSVIQSVFASKSWRVTRPLRWLGDLFR